MTQTDVGNPVTIAVLSNDTSSGTLDPQSLAPVANPSFGALTLDAAHGSFVYTPNPGFVGTDTFTYRVSDHGALQSNVARVSVVVVGPTANDDFATSFAGSAINIDALENDSDPHGANQLVESSVAIASAPTHGSLSIDSGTGEFHYTPAPGFAGTDRFTYTVQDSRGAQTNTGTVSVVTEYGQISGVIFLDFNAGARCLPVNPAWRGAPSTSTPMTMADSTLSSPLL